MMTGIWTPGPGPTENADWFLGDAGDDVEIDALGGDDVLEGWGGNDELLGGSGKDYLEGGADDDLLFGDHRETVHYSLVGDDTLVGGSGNDTLVGGGGFDSLDGGDGFDVASYQTIGGGPILASLEDPSLNTGSAIGDIYVSIEGLRGGGGNDTLQGDSASNVLEGGDGNDDLNGGVGGLDTLRGGMGNDILWGTQGGHTLFEGGEGNDVMWDYEGNDTFQGGAGDDVVNASFGVNVIDGGDGRDILQWSEWFESFTASLADPDLNTGPTDRDSYTAVEGLGGGYGDDTLHGDGGANELRGGHAGADALYGGEGDDTLVGGSSGDTLNGGLGLDSASYLSSGNVAVVASLANPAINTGHAAGDTYISIENLIGTNAADTLHGDGDDNRLSGAGGADTLYGGEGSDTADYATQTIGGIIASLANPTINTGHAAGDTYHSIENLSGTINADQLYGADGQDNRLEGGAGNDTLRGLDGNDRLVGGAGADSLVGAGGIDIASYETSTTWVSAYLEASHLNAGDAAGDTYDSIEGLIGGSGHDILIGASSFGDLWGGDGDDYLRIYASGSLSGDAGSDTLVGSNSVDLLDGGDGNDTIYGSIGNDTLYGGSDDDWMHGGDGVDVMYGGAGNDIYFLNAKNDYVFEEIDEGIDTVHSAVTFILGANFENLVLDGTAKTGRGNELDNYISGNNANNTLEGQGGNDTLVGADGGDILKGGTGADSMAGGLNNDEYYVDDAADIVVESAGQGTDTVYSVISFTLPENFEFLRLQGGFADLSGTGNGANNRLFGNKGANLLQGMGGGDSLVGAEGNDTLEGGGGNDTLEGGTGRDLFRMSASAAGTDTITGFVTTADKFDLSGGLFTAMSIDGADTLLTHGGGKVKVLGISTLTLTQWNALVVSGPSSLSAGAPELQSWAANRMMLAPAELAGFGSGDWSYA